MTSKGITMRHLRPFERRVFKMYASGVPVAEIGHRFGKSPERIRRTLEWIEIPRTRPAPRRFAEAFEQRVLTLRRDGHSYQAIANRFDRSAEFIARVERLSRLRDAVRDSSEDDAVRDSEESV